ncbi:MAG: phage terminase large subunit [Candidatus Kapabacteria bacterium]|nr:phage terminase large subunit [Candidatus Kapabacteria bacterium]
MKRTLKDRNINLTDNFPETPAEFAELISNGKWKRAPHLELINQLLVSLTLRKEKKVIVNLPPRHGKSEFISKFFPAWYLMKNKTHRIILTSYGNKFSASWGKKVIQIIENWGEKLANVKISPKSKSASSFDLEEFGGGMDCVGISGALTGKGADLLIIDDPIKNDKEAHSKKIRDNIWEWFLSTAFTRLEPDGIIIIVMTRWHEDDLVGRIIEKKDIEEHSNINIFDWKFIKLPAIAEESDILGRNHGEALWSERFNSQKLLEIKEILGSYWFEALYQQNPRPAGGEIFKRKFFKYYYEDLEHYYLRISSASNNKQVKIVRKIDCSLFATVDLAVSTKNSSDFTVIIVFGLTPDKEIILLDLIRDRIIGSEHLNLIRDVFKRWEGILVGIESVQYQVSLIQTFEREGLKVIALKPIKDKLSRALPISAKLEAGYVFFPENSHWLKNFEDELLAFPNSKYDDQVDAFSYISYLIEKISLSTPASSLLKKLTKNNITSNF